MGRNRKTEAQTPPPEAAPAEVPAPIDTAPAKAPQLKYIARVSFTFADKHYEPGDIFDHPLADGRRLAAMKLARRIELAHVLDEQSRKAKYTRPPGKVVHNRPAQATG